MGSVCTRSAGRCVPPAAGADVIVIAPWQVQSGRDTAVTNSGTFWLGTKTLPAGYANDCSEAPAKGQVYGLCLDTAPCTMNSASATPSDTVKFGTRGGLEALAGWARWTSWSAAATRATTWPTR